MPQEDPSRTEQATPRRREKAREEGSVPKGQELPKVTVLIAGLIALHLFLPLISKQLLSIYSWLLGESVGMNLTKNSVYELLLVLTLKLAIMLLPVMFLIALMAFVTLRLQVGPLWTTKVLKPKFNQMFNPMGGIQKLMLDPKFIARMGRSVLQAAAVAWAPYVVLKKEIHNLPPLFYADVVGIMKYILTTGSKMVMYALIPMLLIAVADLVYARWDYEEQLKMTKDEVKDERRQAEGDPQVKKEQMKKMFSVMQKRMLQNVPEADVVITNPTHVAVALQYNPSQAPAPLVLAKGLDHLAEKIKQVAKEHDVPIKQDPPLARALYDSVEIGETIPEELYQAVATILAQVYKHKPRKQ